MTPFEDDAHQPPVDPSVLHQEQTAAAIKKDADNLGQKIEVDNLGDNAAPSLIIGHLDDEQRRRQEQHAIDVQFNAEQIENRRAKFEAKKNSVISKCRDIGMIYKFGVTNDQDFLDRVLRESRTDVARMLGLTPSNKVGWSARILTYFLCFCHFFIIKTFVAKIMGFSDAFHSSGLSWVIPAAGGALGSVAGPYFLNRAWFPHGKRIASGQKPQNSYTYPSMLAGTAIVLIFYWFADAFVLMQAHRFQETMGLPEMTLWQMVLASGIFGLLYGLCCTIAPYQLGYESEAKTRIDREQERLYRNSLLGDTTLLDAMNLHAEAVDLNIRLKQFEAGAEKDEAEFQVATAKWLNERQELHVPPSPTDIALLVKKRNQQEVEEMDLRNIQETVQEKRPIFKPKGEVM